ncbi:MAG TPA: heparan-alpha-glucosaminide N-acetyltransferase domain-containing protein, partial [Chryseosolibacter sp.]
MTTATLPTDLVTEKQRINSIDIVRGIVMVVMALDHARDFFYVGGYATDPTNLAATTPALFFTRWITHYCAPTFVFLSGTSIFLNLQKKSKKEMSVFLLTRGLWLIVLELIVVRFAIVFNFYYDVIFFQVIWVIGASMICMAALLHLKYKVVLAIGLMIVFGHNSFDGLGLQPGDSFFALWTILRQAGLIPLTENNTIFVIYPLLPWLGIMILGYCLGKLYSREFNSNERKKYLLILGSSAIALFVILRSVNIYGDPAPWSVQKNGMFTLMSFLNTTKYPVSLLYTLMTIGPVLIILALMEGVKVNFLKPFHVFGRVPMFYYVLHFSLIHFVS